MPDWRTPHTPWQTAGARTLTRWFKPRQNSTPISCRAYAWTTARTPVVQRQDGAWIPGSPFQALCPGPSPQFFPNYHGAWIYDAELGAHNLVDEGVLDPLGPQAAYAADYLEDRQFIDNEFGVITAEATRKDWFNRGGFGRAQPFYGRFVQMHGQRDDVKPFIRSYFNQLGVMFNREDLSIYENPGASVWNKTFETGNFLQQSRMMFVMERDNMLWLAPFVTAHWMKDGMRVVVKNAPTYFGPVSYRIESHVESRVPRGRRGTAHARHTCGRGRAVAASGGQTHQGGNGRWPAA